MEEEEHLGNSEWHVIVWTRRGLRQMEVELQIK